MQYDFSLLFQDNNSDILHEFIDTYTTLIHSGENDISKLLELYQSILDTFSQPFKEEDLLQKFQDLASHEVAIENPYIIVSNEIYCLQRLLSKRAVLQNSTTYILDFFTLFNKINNKVAEVYLEQYLQKLISINNIRIRSIAELIHKNMIGYYEAHLVWLSNLARYIQDQDINALPELDEHKCEFGVWLDTQSKHVIQDAAKYKTIVDLHSDLHTFGEKISNHIGNQEYHVLITYLEKCELLSLSIGTELALIDNIMMNNQISKDELTGAMNRHGLHTIFQNQYELSLATGNSFVLAICDLDFFKKINDTYGHITGDEVLKLFVKVCKKHIRNSDIIVRYGGEEFIIILPAITKTKGFDVLERIRQDFEGNYILQGDTKIQATTSVGLVEIKPTNYYSQNFLNEYINIADQKLYIAKKSGRNKVEVC